jgi:hypothetical protein
VAQPEAWHRAWAFWILDEWRMHANEEALKFFAWADEGTGLREEDLNAGRRYYLSLQKLSIAMWERAYFAIHPGTAIHRPKVWEN